MKLPPMPPKHAQTVQAPITAIRVRPVQIPLHTSFAISQGALNSADCVFIAAEDAEGRVGIGEAAPFPVLTFDTQAVAQAVAVELADALVGRTPSQALAQLTGPLWAEASRSVSARAGLELALWDLRARAFGIPLAELWGTAGRDHAQTDITLPLCDRSEVPGFWARFAAHGFPYVKVKVGGDTEADLGRIAALLEQAPGTRISLDGNQGLDEAGALRLLAALARIGVTPLFFEQPLPRDDWAGMARFTQRSPIPVCADELVQTAADAIRVVRDRAAHMVNLKFMKSGVGESLHIAQIARAAGLGVMIGGMVESEIAMTASLHAYCGTGLIDYCDLDTPFFFSDDVSPQSPYRDRSARLALPPGPGLGLTLRPEYTP